MRFLKSLARSEKGAAMTEYALLVALVAIAVMAAIVVFREEIIRTFTTVADVLGGV
ncbi:MAG: Flp family type IVb pilin [Candidatus Eisenbacteria bacterium]